MYESPLHSTCYPSTPSPLHPSLHPSTPSITLSIPSLWIQRPGQNRQRPQPLTSMTTRKMRVPTSHHLEHAPQLSAPSLITRKVTVGTPPLTQTAVLCRHSNQTKSRSFSRTVSLAEASTLRTQTSQTTRLGCLVSI